MALGLQAVGGTKQVLHDISWRRARLLLPLVRRKSGCMLKQIHFLTAITRFVKRHGVGTATAGQRLLVDQVVRVDASAV